MSIKLNLQQTQTVDQAGTSRTFIFGAAGTGKTTTALYWLDRLIRSGFEPQQILLITPQKSYTKKYISNFERIFEMPFPIQNMTMNGIAQRAIDRFWPIILSNNEYRFSAKPPTFLTLETSQYFMMSIVKQKLDQGQFSEIILDPNRLASQLLDNLNKAALVGFEPSEIQKKLSDAWSGDERYLRSYAEAQQCVLEFREFCVRRSLLDFSLQLELFTKILWKEPIVSDHLTHEFDHLIIDHIDEDVPRSHDILLEWIPKTASTLAIYNTNGAYRTMLGADPLSGKRIFNVCANHVRFNDKPTSIECFEMVNSVSTDLIDKDVMRAFSPEDRSLIRDHFQIRTAKFYPEILDQITDEIIRLLNEEHYAPSDIAILAPYVNDTLLTSLSARLQKRGFPTNSLRPSRSLFEDPVIRAVLTVAKLCFPEWGLRVTHEQLAHTIFTIFEDIDLIRATLLADIVLRKDGQLSDFDLINEQMARRIGRTFGNRYEQFRLWITENRSDPTLPLDIFIRKFFGEVLSSEGYFLKNYSLDTEKINDLVESIRKFRMIFQQFDENSEDNNLIGREYISLVENGILSAIHGNQIRDDTVEELIITPATNFVMNGERVKVQFWLDIGSQGWFERINQPLTHPYVLSRNWDPSKKWTDTDEYENNKRALVNLFSGLTGLVSERVYLCYSQYSESGFEQKGMLLKMIQKLFT